MSSTSSRDYVFDARGAEPHDAIQKTKHAEHLIWSSGSPVEQPH